MEQRWGHNSQKQIVEREQYPQVETTRQWRHVKRFVQQSSPRKIKKELLYPYPRVTA